MLQRILSILGWVGTALVFAAVAIRFLSRTGTLTIQPDQERYVYYASWAGLALVVLYTLGQWREIVDVLPPAPGALRRDRHGRRPRRARDRRRRQLPVGPAEQALGPDGQPAEQPVRADGQGAAEPHAPVKFTVFDRQTELERFRTRLDEYAYKSRQVSVEYIDPDTKPVVAREYDDSEPTARSSSTTWASRERVTSDSEQDLTNALIKAMSGDGAQGLLPAGPRREGAEPTPSATATARVSGIAASGQLHGRAAGARPAEGRPGRRHGGRDCGSDERPAAGGSRTRCRRYLARAGKLMVLVDPPIGATGGAAAQSRGAPQGMGHHARQQRRRRRQRRHQRAEHRRGGDLSAARDHRTVRAR